MTCETFNFHTCITTFVNKRGNGSDMKIDEITQNHIHRCLSWEDGVNSIVGGSTRRRELAFAVLVN